MFQTIFSSLLKQAFKHTHTERQEQEYEYNNMQTRRHKLTERVSIFSIIEQRTYPCYYQISSTV